MEIEPLFKQTHVSVTRRRDKGRIIGVIPATQYCTAMWPKLFEKVPCPDVVHITEPVFRARGEKTEARTECARHFL
jgi:hypothetical protein